MNEIEKYTSNVIKSLINEKINLRNSFNEMKKFLNNTFDKSHEWYKSKGMTDDNNIRYYALDMDHKIDNSFQIMMSKTDDELDQLNRIHSMMLSNED